MKTMSRLNSTDGTNSAGLNETDALFGLGTGKVIPIRKDINTSSVTETTGDFINAADEVTLNFNGGSTVKRITLPIEIAADETVKVTIQRKKYAFGQMTGNIEQSNEYVITKMKENIHKAELEKKELVRKIEVLKEANEVKVRRAVYIMSKKHSLLKYYTLVWSVGALLVGIFATSGLSGFLNPIPSVVGTFLSLVGVTGAFLDWKDKEMRNAY